MGTSQDYRVPNAANEDFFRSALGTTLPNGTADTTESINRTGQVGLGHNLATIANLDLLGTSAERPLPFGNIAASGPIGTAAATVDLRSSIEITQNTAGVIATLPAPTVANPGKNLTVFNSGLVPLSLNGITLTPGTFLRFLWSGTAWLNAPTVGAAAGLKKFRVVQNLVVGNNLINHGLTLSPSTATIVEVRTNGGTGTLVSVGVLTETANSLIINVGVAVANARITIIG